MRKCTRKVDGMIYSFHQWVVINDELFGVIEDDEGNVFPCLFNQIKFVKSEMEIAQLKTYTPQQYLEEFNEGKYKYIAMDGDGTWTMYISNHYIPSNNFSEQWQITSASFYEIPKDINIKFDGDWNKSLHSLE